MPADRLTTPRGLGLTTMRERVAIVNGTFSIVLPPDGGTEIEIHIPLEQSAAGEG
jgi:signal transduction histidine kinase